MGNITSVAIDHLPLTDPTGHNISAKQHPRWDVVIATPKRERLRRYVFQQHTPPAWAVYLRRVHIRRRAEALRIYQPVQSYPDASRAVDHQACAYEVHNFLGHFAHAFLPLVDHKCVCVTLDNIFVPALLFVLEEGRCSAAPSALKQLSEHIHVIHINPHTCCRKKSKSKRHTATTVCSQLRRLEQRVHTLHQVLCKFPFRVLGTRAFYWPSPPWETRTRLRWTTTLSSPSSFCPFKARAWIASLLSWARTRKKSRICSSDWAYFRRLP